MNKNGSSRNQEFGQSITELALTLSFVVILLAGVADIGRAIFTYIAIRDAAQEGAAYGSVAPDDCTNIITRAQNITEDFIHDTADIDVGIADLVSPGVWETSYEDCSTATPDPGDRIRVTITYDNFSLATPFLGTLIGTQNLTLTTSVIDNILISP